MGTSRVWADPGWNPGLSEAEALAPGRKASEHTFPCCESRGALGDKLWVNSRAGNPRQCQGGFLIGFQINPSTPSVELRTYTNQSGNSTTSKKA